MRSGPCAPLILVLIASCVTPSRHATAPRTDWTTQAALLLADLRRLDYRAPMAPTRTEARDRAAALFHQACDSNQGTSPCIWSLSLSFLADPEPSRWDRAADAIVVLATRCLDLRDDAACRAFDGEVGVYRELWVRAQRDKQRVTAWCMRGLGAACYVAGSWKPQADAERLDETRHACELGYATACWGLDLNDETVRWWTHEIRDALVVRAGLPGCARGSAWGCVHAGKPDEARVAAIDGCMHGYLEECEIEIHDLHMQRAQYEQVCRLTGRKCLRLADELRELDATAARDALEHGCQFGERMACAELVRGYRDRTFPEPVPDRGAQLAAFLCKSDDRKSSCERKRD